MSPVASETLVIKTGYTPTLYFPVAALLAGTMPEPPRATIGCRTDGQPILYPATVSAMIAPPETGKTRLSLTIGADVLFDGGSVLVIDIDHNGAPAIIAILRSYGVPVATLSDITRFRYAAPEDSAEMLAVVAEAKIWKPTFALLDSVGELLPMFGANSNDADDYTRVHRAVLTALANTGACVLAIDHEAKGIDSRNYGGSGTAAKKRAIDGVIYRLTLKTTFIPGHGGKAAMTILKDRHGDIRAASPAGDKEPLFAIFELIQHGTATDWKFWAPKPTDLITDTALESDADEIDQLTPPPTSVRDVQARLQWSPRRAAPALNYWRERVTQTESLG